ncbi:MAG: T9SS type A sorting domain-containing protein [Bacteroidota bacterium]
MKKNLLLFTALALVLTTSVSNAQLINPGFETWTNDLLVPTAMNPNSGNGITGWWDYNFFNNSMLGSSPVSVTRCSDTVHSGSYSVRLETKVYTPTSWNIYKSWGIPFIGHEYNDTLGILFDGNVNATSVVFRPGIPCTEKLTQFKFWYQYKPVGGDTAECRVELVKLKTPVAGGWFKSNVATGGSGWQQATIDFTYVSAATPDTLWILFSSSSLDSKPKAGSVMWIDDASVTLPIGIEEMLGEDNNVEIFPNPSIENFFTVKSSDPIDVIEIFDALGQKIKEDNVNKLLETNIATNEFKTGIYYLKIHSGDKIHSKKIVIQ